MTVWLSPDELRRTNWAGDLKPAGPIPTRVVSNGEYTPPPQTDEQRAVEAAFAEIVDARRARYGFGRRAFLRSAAGLAAGFLAMNKVYGAVFDVREDELDLDAAAERRARFAEQFVFDVQVHFVSDRYRFPRPVEMRKHGLKYWNPLQKEAEAGFAQIRFDNFVKEVFLDSETSVALLSGAPSDAEHNWFLENKELAEARARVNELCGSRRLLCHAVIVPGQPNWLGEIDRLIEEMKPDGWKGYTVGDPMSKSRYPYRLDDEKLMYPAYERFKKSGIKNVCIHKGLIPEDYAATLDGVWQYAMVDDVAKAAKDWPDLNFVIYHAALKPGMDPPAEHLAKLEKTGRIDWVSDLAAIPKLHGVSNVYADIGTSFAASATTHPAHAAAMLGVLVDGLGADHVLWGTDSVWWGSPQWQIEALRRIEIPEPLRKRLGVAPLGAADGPVKTAIFGRNGAKVFGLADDQAIVAAYSKDKLSEARARYSADGADRSNLAYGFVHR